MDQESTDLVPTTAPKSFVPLNYLNFGNYLANIGQASRIHGEIPLPKDLLSPPGLLGDLSTWILRTAIKPQPVLALAAAISACCTLMGRKIQTQTGLRTNIYIVGTGETSCGKDHPRQMLKELYIYVGCDEFLGPEELSSDVALISELSEQPAMLLLFDEIGFMLRAIKSGGMSYLAALVPLLMKLESTAGSTYLGKAYADKSRERVRIEQPCVSLFGTTVPSRYYQALTPDQVIDGFISRLIVFEADDPNPRSQMVHVKDREIPEPILDAVETWLDYDAHIATCGNTQATLSNASLGPKPRVVEFSVEAEWQFELFENYIRQEMDRQRPWGLDGLWGKVRAQAMRLSLIHACSVDPLAAEIGVNDAAWAIVLMAILTHNAVTHAANHISGNSYEADVKKVSAKIRYADKAGIGHSTLLKALPGIPANRLKEIIERLLDQEEIRVEMTPGRGRTPQHYFIRRPGY